MTGKLTTIEPQSIEKPAAQMLEIIASAAKDSHVDVAKMTALLDMQERIMTKQAEIDFNQAYSRLSGKLPRIDKDGQVEYDIDKNNPSKGKKKAFKFATYENIDRIIRPLLQEEGFALSFNVEQRPGEGGGAIVTGTLSHIGGHSRKASIAVALDTSGGKNNIQAMGSSFSYGKRYTAIMLLNIVTEGSDDDGVAGGMVFVTKEQVQIMEALIEETKSNLDAFLQTWQIAKLENMPSTTYPVAMNMLAAKKRKQQNENL